MGKKVLLCAYACEPHKGSEPGVGWEMSIHLAQKSPNNLFFTITRRNNKQVIDKEDYPSNLSFIYYDLPKPFLFIKRNFPFVRIYYYLWMFGAALMLLKKKNKFNIIHHITFVNDWFPSLFILLKTSKNKFIWGPIGSNEQVESRFIFKRKHRFLEKTKTFFLKCLRAFDIFFWLCKKNSDVIIGTGIQVKRNINLKDKYAYKFINLSAIGISKSQLKEQEKTEKHIDFLIISAGQFKYIKNFRLTIRSFDNFLKLVPKKDKPFIKLQLAGDGDQKMELLKLVKKLNLSNNIDFVGQLKQIELMTSFNTANVFLYPTLENAGFVILEAMSKSLPVVALNYGGPRQFVKENRELQLTSYKLSLSDIEKDMSQKLFMFYKDRKLSLNAGRKNFKTVNDYFTWEAKAERILNIYNNFI